MTVPRISAYLRPWHVERHPASGHEDEVEISCDCEIGHDHTYAEWLETPAAYRAVGAYRRA